ncbi:putative calpain family cysteine protease [Rhypophila sp. PSN 637]
MAPKPDFNKTPQEVVHVFWNKYFTKKPGKVTSIFPRNLYASLLPDTDPRGSSSSRNAVHSYEAAAKECREKVAMIVKEAHRTNEKFTDLDFNIEWDRDGLKNCLKGLIRPEKDDDSGPESVHRVDWIFDEPKFTKNGYSSSDLRQGQIGDSWFLTAVANIANRQDLMNKICVARDEQVGVYGFVFYRDGDWFSVVVDDYLYLSDSDFDHGKYDPTGKHAHALHFAKCHDPNETWLPLLEKAYAKAHGDFEALRGGRASEGVEDMTGGVGTDVKVNSILNKDKFWNQLVNVDGDFVFSCCCAEDNAAHDHKGGMPTKHAYSILKATEEVDEDGNKVRLVLIRNPWGQRQSDGTGEWNGPWSDGSKERTPYWLKRLGHTFGDDGTFWMTYQDMLRVCDHIYRTRLFDEKWTVVQQWTSIRVGWIAGYHNTKFVLEVKKAGMVVVVLTQGLGGQYRFHPFFILRREGEVEHICRAANPRFRRSVSCEIELEAGRYVVLPKLLVERYWDRHPVEEMVKQYADSNPAKLLQVGMQYDLAHAKGGVPDEDHVLTTKKERKKRKEERRKKNEKERARRRRRVTTTATVTNNRVETKTEHVEGVDNDAHKCLTAPATGDADSKEDPKVDDKLEDAIGDATVANDDKKDDKAGDVKPEDVGDNKKDDKTDDGKQEEKTGDVKPEYANNDKEDNTCGTKPEDAPTDGKEEGEEKKDQENEGGNTEGTSGFTGNNPQLEEAQGEAATEESEEESDEEEEDEEEKPVEDEDGRIPWNAVCVLGLRVYSQDPELTVTLGETKDMEEGACLVVDSHAVGATMARL